MSENNVIPLGNITRLDFPPDRILEEAKGKMKGVVLLGWTVDDGLYVASSIADGGDVLWLLEHTKKLLLEVGEEL